MPSIQEAAKQCFRKSNGSIRRFTTEFEQYLENWECKYVGPTGYVYVIGWRDSAYVKVGFSADPEKRLATLQTNHPETLVLESVIATETPTELENTFHKCLKDHQSPGKSREWFKRGAVETLIKQYERGVFLQDLSTSVSEHLKSAGFNDVALLSDCEDPEEEASVFRWLSENLGTLPQQAYFKDYYRLYQNWCSKICTEPCKAIMFSKRICTAGMEKVRRTGENGWWIKMPCKTIEYLESDC